MKKTLHIDETVLREARQACGASTDTETVRLGLDALIRLSAYQRRGVWLAARRAQRTFQGGGLGG